MRTWDFCVSKKARISVVVVAQTRVPYRFTIIIKDYFSLTERSSRRVRLPPLLMANTSEGFVRKDLDSANNTVAFRGNPSRLHRQNRRLLTSISAESAFNLTETHAQFQSKLNQV